MCVCEWAASSSYILTGLRQSLTKTKKKMRETTHPLPDASTKPGVIIQRCRLTLNLSWSE